MKKRNESNYEAMIEKAREDIQKVTSFQVVLANRYRYKYAAI